MCEETHTLARESVARFTSAERTFLKDDDVFSNLARLSEPRERTQRAKVGLVKSALNTELLYRHGKY